MDLKRAERVLREHNRWRRWDGSGPGPKAHDPAVLGQAIDYAIRVLVQHAADADEIARLRAEVEALREDAERYRIWRAHYTAHDVDAEPSDMLLALTDAWTPDEVDAAIDAARKESK